MAAIRVVLADDHEVLRRGLRSVLESDGGFEVVGEASDGVAALALVERLVPDILVTDLTMPALGGIEVVRRVSKRLPRVRVVVLSMQNSEAYVLGALRGGASAYVSKDAAASELVRAIREALAGRHYLSAPFASRAVDSYLQGPRAVTEDAYDDLTEREREVLQLSAEGMTSTQLAEKLHISSRTAETHRANLMRKLGLHSRAELIRYAARRGLIQLDAPPSDEFPPPGKPGPEGTPGGSPN